MPANEDTGSPPELASLPKATTPGTSPWDWPMGLARTPTPSGVPGLWQPHPVCLVIN